MPRSPDIRKLAHRQQGLLLLFLVGVIVQSIPLFFQASVPGQSSSTLLAFSSLMQIVVSILMFAGVLRVLLVDGTHPVVIVLCGIFMMATWANLLVLLLVTRGATRELRNAGLRVGFMGVDPEEVERVLNVALCTKCGYNLHGLTEPRCPECDTAFDPDSLPESTP